MCICACGSDLIISHDILWRSLFFSALVADGRDAGGCYFRCCYFEEIVEYINYSSMGKLTHIYAYLILLVNKFRIVFVTCCMVQGAG